MTDYTQALAAAREAMETKVHSLSDGEHILASRSRALRDLIAAIDAAAPDVDAETKAWAAWTAEHPGNNWTAAEAFSFRRAFIDGYRAALSAARAARPRGGAGWIPPSAD